MGKIILTEGQNDRIESLFSKIDAFKDTIRFLSEDIKTTEEMVWPIIQEWYPQTKGMRVCFNRENSCIEFFDEQTNLSN